MNDILVEICCGSFLDALEAEKAGADRIELNSSLFFGGLTPSAGTIAKVKEEVSIPCMVMIRPRGIGFCYTEEELSAMERDIDIALDLGADGFVFGVLNEDSTIDINACKRLIKRCGDREIMFHRAFDVVPNPIEALDIIIDLGFHRILTSGQAKNSYEGIAFLKQIIERSKGQIEILPGGGIRSHNVVEICERTGCTQVHLGPLRKVLERSSLYNPEIKFLPSELPREDSYEIVDREVVEEIVRLVKHR
ncbi:MAG: copper homeostasis protein CutC [Clostridiales bacterium]|nr:copper homeostasis protein CutC [Clostridiales bacterium]